MTPLRHQTFVLAVSLAASLALQNQAPSASDLAAAIDQLGSLDSYDVRMEASRTVRRASADLAVPALTRAAREHADEYGTVPRTGPAVGVFPAVDAGGDARVPRRP